MLNERQLHVIDNHFTHAGSREVKSRVPLDADLSSVYDPKTGRLHAHYMDARYSGKQELVFESAASRATTMTSHRIKFWDERRYATDRELARIQGFPESFILPTACAQNLFGNAVAVPCALHACVAVGDGTVPPRTFVDLCAGIGGFHLAVTQAWVGVRCVGYAEIKPSAIRCYEQNFPGTPAMGDLTGVTQWPRADLLTAGFPCQPFSRALKTDRAAHPARRFFEQIFRAIDGVAPRLVVLENVRSILNTGRAFLDEILERLAARDYQVDWCSLNAYDFGLPQQRHRVYIVARKSAEAHATLPPLKIPDAPWTPKRTLGDIMETRGA